MIEVEGLTKYYGPSRAIENVTFSVNRGEVLGFLGPNGSGKTTTMRILTCFMPATRGSVRVAGHDVFRNPLEVKKNIGYLPENVPLYTDMTVRGFLNFFAEIKGVEKGTRKARIDEVMANCGVEDVGDKLISKLSKGYRQRVGLAQALLNNPPVLILDEPTTGLDPRQIIEIRELIRRLSGEKTVILCTHILPEVEMLCGRVLIINEGTVVAEDTPENLTTGLQRSHRIHLQVEGPAAEVAASLEEVPGVLRVKQSSPPSSGPHSYDLEVDKSDEARKALARMIVNRGWGLLEMRTIDLSLEDVFVKLVTTENGG
ncbi:MAG: ATP-binding cassette domain-containing protein [Candidatus Tectomicrobia bacterium]|uniref:ATP-binding cassette domain-containing protein n=1 Tax=Tectimicrobiota bacterium TaxID=2528274 RepID=A0A932GM69_UNCTE|nr:ATP-binding cassette domain-containing protein [Candidatus Tectomicrobia bacterium]